MSVTIIRNTGWLGTGTRVSIKLNGEKVAKIANDQQIRLDLRDDKT